MKKIQAKKVGSKKAAKQPESPASLIDARIASFPDWRGETLARLRAVIKEAVPDVIEEWKWRGTPVWSHSGMICTGETYKAVVKMTFAKGAALEDPAGLFNSSLDGNVRRAIDFHEGDKLNKPALKALLRAAAALNAAKGKKPTEKAVSPAKRGSESSAAAPKKASKAAPSPSKAQPMASKAKPTASKTKPVLLSGGNPQIAKADGDAPVQAYIAALPGWKGDIGRKLDALIVRQVPGVQKAVKWNSPFYGLAGRGYFLSFHVFARYVKVTFFRGTSLEPLPPGASKVADTRYADLHEGELDEAQMTKWVKQAAALPGWTP
jgi:hypothetical protein